MAFTQRTVTHNFQNADGSPASGTVTFALTRRMTNGATTIVPAAEVTGTLNGTGQLSVSLAANNDTGTVPTDAGWNVTLRIAGARQEEFLITVPTGTGPVDLGSLLPSTGQVT